MSAVPESGEGVFDFRRPHREGRQLQAEGECRFLHALALDNDPQVISIPQHGHVLAFGAASFSSSSHFAL